MARPPGERLLRVIEDPDLGRLELWVWSPPRSGWAFGKRPSDFYEWRGVTGQLPFIVSIDQGVEPEAQLVFLDRMARATIVSLSDREPELRRETAAREIALARDWTESATLTEKAFSDSLCLSEINVLTDKEDTNIEVYFDDTANIFAGHVVTTTLDKAGNIIATGIAG